MIKFKDILENKILVPRKLDKRKEDHKRIILQKIQQYIKDGSKGDLDLSYTPITSLPNNLKTVGGNLHLNDTPITSLPDNLEVGGYLYLVKTPLAKKHTEEEIEKMIKDKGGYVKRGINA